MDVSVIVPVYNEEESLQKLYASIDDTLSKLNITYEIVFVDDGSDDNTFDILRKLSQMRANVKVIQFRRNYGKACALAAGFSSVTGAVVITMDADLQDDPKEIPNFIKKLNEGYDLVSGWKFQRKDPLNKTIPSRLFNKITSLVTGIKIHDFNCGFKAYKQEVIKNLKLYGEFHRYIPALAHWDGFKIGEIKVEHHPRSFGKSKYGAWRFFSGLFDLITLISTARFVQKQLHFFGFIGLLLLSVGVAINIILAIIKYTEGLTLTSPRPLLCLILGVFLIIVGLQTFSIGLIGEMIFRSTYSEGRENYLIKNILE